MTCPPHKWIMIQEHISCSTRFGVIKVKCKECGTTLPNEEATHRINACEILSVEQANSIAANLVPEVFKPNSVELAQKEILNRYAKILGGEECTTNS